MKHLLQLKYYNTRWSNSLCGHLFGWSVWCHRLFHQEKNAPVFLTLPNQFPWRTRASISARVPACSYSSPSKGGGQHHYQKPKEQKTPKPSYLTIFFLFNLLMHQLPILHTGEFFSSTFFFLNRKIDTDGANKLAPHKFKNPATNTTKGIHVPHGIHGTGIFTVHLVDFMVNS